LSFPYLALVLDRRPGQRERRVGASTRLIIAWSGMRGRYRIEMRRDGELSNEVMNKILLELDREESRLEI
jgi:hypothetical protein